ncbi:glycoside hydrolase family 26 protein [Streptomyces sp. NPDC060194]|uniref:glycoside hydrolase family 26 protein n=1 Tax=Streptomyces sp. NPDC060194 TaxID=3347069 RepID=UPI00364716AC
MADRKYTPRSVWLGAAVATLLVTGFALPQEPAPEPDPTTSATPAAPAVPPPSPPEPSPSESPSRTVTTTTTADENGASSTTETVEPAPAPAPAAPETAVGAYLHYGPPGIARMGELQKWLGGTELKVGHTYLPGDLWSNIEGGAGFLDAWAQWRKEKDDRLFVLNVPMQERNEGGVGNQEVARLLKAGAAGEFDRHYRVLAERLVRLGIPDTVIVLGWEMNGITYTSRCGPDPASWKAYWRRIVTEMRAVEGQRFKFDFAPNRGRDAIPWTECYPGDDVVDIIGMDSYDQPPGRTFDEQVNEEYGLRKHVEFAKERGKPISYPEWGLFRYGDNPEYMRRMLEWIDEHKPMYQTITDYCPHGVWQCGSNPASSKVFRDMMTEPGGPAPSPTPEPTPTPTPTPKPTEPSRPQNCMPLELGSWVEQWMGGKMCVRFHWWDKW